MSGRAVVLIFLALTVISSWGTLRWIRGKNAAIDRVGLVQARLTLADDHGEDLNEIQSASSAAVFYRVTLRDAPLGEKLSLHCDWIDPQGMLARRRTYEMLITSEILKTDCKAEFSPDSAPGAWTVEMYLQRRKLSQKNFRVTRPARD